MLDAGADGGTRASRRRAETSAHAAETGAVDPAAADVRDRVRESKVRRLRLPVRPEQPGLPAAESPLVGQQEIEERADVRLAVGEPEGVGELGRLVV
jgi:hypothetical protein